MQSYARCEKNTMKNSFALAVLCALALLACSGSSGTTPKQSEESAGAEPETTTEVVAAPEESSAGAPAAKAASVEAPLPAAAAIVTIKVKDYDAWKEAFDARQQARQDAGIRAHHINRGAKDPNLVVVHLSADDADKLEAFLNDKATRDAMKASGVKGKPEIAIITPVENRTATDPALPAAIVQHEVKDYDAWKQAFDADATRRTEAGLVGYAVNRDQKKPNMVVVYLQGSTRESVDGFLANPELKKVMKDAGVKGKPKIVALQGVEVGQYPN
jgi:quinol monooxygenase YgiN